ncbi:hypothetical protein DFH09DRAFT_1348738 [Mycena vulgaris]|nr:hypothetical protein DFH09DRAFT_1348738 [Mycena vulgaris]
MSAFAACARPTAATLSWQLVTRSKHRYRRPRAPDPEAEETADNSGYIPWQVAVFEAPPTLPIRSLALPAITPQVRGSVHSRLRFEGAAGFLRHVQKVCTELRRLSPLLLTQALREAAASECDASTLPPPQSPARMRRRTICPSPTLTLRMRGGVQQLFLLLGIHADRPL